MHLSKQLTLIKKLGSSYKSGVSPIKIFRDYPNIEKALNAGTPLAEALKKEDNLLNEIYVNLIDVGEKSGRLEETFALIAELMQGIIRIRKEILSGLQYPVTVLGVYLLIFLVFIMGIVPSIAGFMQNANTELPLVLTIVLNIRNTLIFAIFGGIIFCAYLFYMKKSISLPVIGYLNKLRDFYIYFYAMKACYASGLSILETVELASHAITNERLRKDFIEIYENIKKQGSLTSVFLDSRIFDREIMEIIETGEDTGSLEQSFSEITRIIEDRITSRINLIVLLIKPLGIVLGIIFLIVIFLFVFSLVSNSFSEINKVLSL